MNLHHFVIINIITELRLRLGLNKIFHMHFKCSLRFSEYFFYFFETYTLFTFTLKNYDYFFFFSADSSWWKIYIEFKQFSSSFCSSPEYFMQMRRIWNSFRLFFFLFLHFRLPNRKRSQRLFFLNLFAIYSPKMKFYSNQQQWNFLFSPYSTLRNISLTDRNFILFS